MSDDPTQSTPVQPIWAAPATPPPAQPENPVAGAPIAPIAPAAQPAIEQVRPVVTAPRRSSSGRWLNLLLGVAAAVAIGGIAFAVGRGTAPATTGFGRNPANAPAFVGRSFDPNASFAPGGGGNGPGFLTSGGLTIEGTVTSVTGDTLTITTADGRTMEVSLGADTEYHQQAAGSASDVTTGSKVSVQLDIGGRGQGANGPAGPTGTASDVTVIP